jgi:hypothetical protein
MWTRSRFNNEYVPGLFALAIDSYENKRSEGIWKKLCEQKKSGKTYEENTLRSGLDLPSVKGEGAGPAYDTQIGGAKQTWVHVVYALAVRISEEAIEDNLYELSAGSSGDKLKEIFKDLGVSMAENEDVLMARFLVNGTATTYHSTRNSKALFAADHPYLDGNTFSNYGTAADLTYTSFWASIVAAENQHDNKQKRILKKVKRLWIPPQLEQKGLEIIKSTDRPDSANRAVNAYAKSGRSIDLQVYPYLSDVDACYYQLDGKGILRFNRRPTRFAREKDFQTGDMMCKADQRWCAEIDNPQGWYGRIPA